MKRVLFFLSIYFVLNQLFCAAQNTVKIDSLTKVLASVKLDTEKINILNALAFEYLYADPEKSFEFAEEAYLKSNRINYNKGIGSSLNSFGNIAFYSGNYDSALIYYNQSLKIFDSIGEKKRSAMCLNNIGTVYHLKGDYIKTIDYYKQSLKIREEISDKMGASDCMNNIGVVFMDQGNFSKALEYYFKTLIIKKELGDKRGVASILSNIGMTYGYISQTSSILDTNNLILSISYLEQARLIHSEIGNIKGIADCQINLSSKYFVLKRYDESMKFANDAKLNYEKVNDKRGISFCYIDISDIYNQRKEYTKAIEYLKMSLKIKIELGEKMGMAESYLKLGEIYQFLNNYRVALDYFNKFLELSEEMSSLVDLSQGYKHLSDIYFNQKNYEKAYQFHVLFKQMQDSLINSDNTKKITQMEMNFQFEQKEREQKLLQQQKDAVKSLELKKQKLIKNTFIVGFFLILVFSFFIFRSYRISKKKSIMLAKQKTEILDKNATLIQQKEEITTQRDEIENQRNEIEKQHHLIEGKNKKITDSIRYAQRIQQAILPMEEKLHILLKDYFVFYQPKDIVSGDFYWAEENTLANKEQIALFAAIDCTGHGVPGAFMSLLGYNGLLQAVKENKLNKPSDILNFLSIYIREMLRKQNEESNVKDGMDLFLCALNRQTMKLEYAGVHNVAYLIRNGELLILKPDNHPIGESFSDEFASYRNNEIQVEKGDTVYLFTDGYIDQFGGKDRKKFMSKRFRDILIEIQAKSMADQKIWLAEVFDEWKAQNDQYDDVLVMGIKI